MSTYLPPPSLESTVCSSPGVVCWQENLPTKVKNLPERMSSLVSVWVLGPSHPAGTMSGMQLHLGPERFSVGSGQKVLDSPCRRAKSRRAPASIPRALWSRRAGKQRSRRAPASIPVLAAYVSRDRNLHKSPDMLLFAPRPLLEEAHRRAVSSI
ncbi:hypothetical protein DFJ74DRAFT_420124 [Hyaloraphidium curvatum]|nr:hypothetical protein DFJ74DRAFT_420124 [Hyaloraphidium curvatum]